MLYSCLAMFATNSLSLSLRGHSLLDYEILEGLIIMGYLTSTGDITRLPRVPILGSVNILVTQVRPIPRHLDFYIEKGREKFSFY